MEITDVNPAESSPAAPQTFDIPRAGTEAYDHWRKTGETKPAAVAAKPKAESAPANTSEGDEPGNDAPVSETGEPKAGQTRPRANAETRVKELLQRQKELNEVLKAAGFDSLDELKTFRKSEQKAEPPKPVEAKQPEPAKGLEAPKKPKLDDFDSYDKYEEARDQYVEDLADYKATSKLQEYEAKQEKLKQDREVQDKLKAAKERYGAEADTVISKTAQKIFLDKSVSARVQEALNESPVLADLLYTLGSGEELDSYIEMAKADPGTAVRKLYALETLVQQELAKGGKSATEQPEVQRDETGKFVKPAKKVTEAPPPPAEVSGRKSAPIDEVDAALKSNDFRSFRAAETRKDIARIKGT